MSVLVLILLCFALSTEARVVTNEGIKQLSRSEQRSNDGNTWCIAKPTTEEQRLEDNIEFSCSQRYVSVDCKAIQPGGPCYNPNNKYSHASAVMNSFYKASNQQPHNCDFQGTGLIITQDPSGGNCKYK